MSTKSNSRPRRGRNSVNISTRQRIHTAVQNAAFRPASDISLIANFDRWHPFPTEPRSRVLKYPYTLMLSLVVGPGTQAEPSSINQTSLIIANAIYDNITVSDFNFQMTSVHIWAASPAPASGVVRWYSPDDNDQRAMTRQVSTPGNGTYNGLGFKFTTAYQQNLWIGYQNNSGSPTYETSYGNESDPVFTVSNIATTPLTYTVQIKGMLVFGTNV